MRPGIRERSLGIPKSRSCRRWTRGPTSSRRSCDDKDRVLAYRPHHDWVRELMTERLRGSNLRVHHETLARTLARWRSAGEATALRNGLIHRVEANAWPDVWRLAADMVLSRGQVSRARGARGRARRRACRRALSRERR
jgi:hypothetical protein